MPRLQQLRLLAGKLRLLRHLAFLLPLQHHLLQQQRRLLRPLLLQEHKQRLRRLRFQLHLQCLHLQQQRRLGALAALLRAAAARGFLARSAAAAAAEASALAEGLRHTAAPRQCTAALTPTTGRSSWRRTASLSE